MAPFDSSFDPLALPGEAVEVLPDGDVYEVQAVEQMAKIGPVDFGAAAAGSQATESNSAIIELDDELEMDPNSLGQFWVNPLSNVEIEVRQTGQQEQRFVNANQTGRITPNTPANQRVVYVYEDGVPHLIVENGQTWDMDSTLVYFTGYKLHFAAEPLSHGDVQSMPGQPAAVPTDSLKRAYAGGRR